MYLIFFALWIIFNGKITLEIVAFGIVFAAVMYWFVCRFLDFSPHKDLVACRRALLFLQYVGVLLKEIVKANFAVIGMIFSSRYVPEPAVVRFKTDLRSNFARVLLADSITLTPGTITVSLSGDEYVVHCLDKSFAEDIDNSVFVELLRNLEKVD